MKIKSGNLFDYLAWRGDISFSKSGLNVIDALAFSVLTYIDFGQVLNDADDPKEITLYDAWKFFEGRNSKEWCSWIMLQDVFVEFFKAIAESKRFKAIKAFNFVEKTDEETHQQFAAVCFQLPGNIAFAAFRGTDNTMTGWKEDLNMSFMYATAGQLAAEEYINNLVIKTDYTIAIGGHSKGGNFAVWSGVRVLPEYRDRITHIYNNDGPGFTDRFLASEAYKAMEPKILSFVPESSIVGILLSHCEYVTIKSTSVSVLQHDPFSWEIVGKRFVYNLERTKSSKLVEQKINDMLVKLSYEEKAKLVEEIFKVIDNEKLKTTDDIKNNIFRTLTVTIPKLIVKMNKFGIKQSKKDR